MNAITQMQNEITQLKKTNEELNNKLQLIKLNYLHFKIQSTNLKYKSNISSLHNYNKYKLSKIDFTPIDDDYDKSHL